jgi:hypothetical protein
MAASDPWNGSMRLPQTPSRHSYCLNNPLAFVDKTGCWPSWGDVLGLGWDIASRGADLLIDQIPSVDSLLQGLAPAAPYIRWYVGFCVDYWNTVLDGVSFLARATGIDRNANYNLADIGAFFLDMEKDEHGVFHAGFDCWQYHFGYNDVYDTVFDLGTSMDRERLAFSYDGEDYVFWAWRGDYTNLGAGAELGVYRRHVADGRPTAHWDADKGLAMPMTLRVKTTGGDSVLSYYPNGPQWWVTGFNPGFMHIPASDLVAIYSMDMSGDGGMFMAFYDVYMDDAEGRATVLGLVINPFTQTVVFVFTPKGMELLCII